jgi:hypothetical protein
VAYVGITIFAWHEWLQSVKICGLIIYAMDRWANQADNPASIKGELMKRVNWEMVGAIAGIFSLIIAVVLAWDRIRSSWLLILAVVILLLGLTVLVTSRQSVVYALRPKPHLAVTIRDINCYVTTRTYTMDNRVSERKQVRETKLSVEIAFKVRNKGGVKATDISALLRLILGEQDGTISFKADPTGKGKKFNLVRNQTLPIVVRFPPVELPQEELTLYPNGPYHLEYTYTCTERPHPKTITVKGRLKKADWTGDSEALQVIREMGFYR